MHCNIWLEQGAINLDRETCRFADRNFGGLKMKLVALTSAALLAATTAFAGNVTYQPDTNVPVVVEEPAGNTGSSGGSAGWIVPLVAIGLIALAVSQSED